MTTPVDRVREILEWWREWAKENRARGFFSVGHAQDQCADELAALLPLLEQQETLRLHSGDLLAAAKEHITKLEARMGEYERALHPGPIEKWDGDWHYHAALYESLTHKKVDGEKA